MARTTINQTAHNEVTLLYEDLLTGETFSRVFWLSGRSIREGADHDPSDPQVCMGLSSRGYTLTAVDGGDLLRVIRREWRACRSAMQRERAQWR